MKRLTLFVIALLSIWNAAAASKSYDLTSPDGTLRVEVEVGDEIVYSLWKNADRILMPSGIEMKLADGTLYNASARFQKVYRTTVDNILEAKYYKKSQVKENYNQLALQFKTFDLIFRAYDSGIAYRFIAKAKGDFKVESEKAEFSFPADWNMYVPYVCQNTKTLESQYMNSFENTYENVPLSAWNKERLAFLPLMVASPDGYKINIMESALTNYAGMYLHLF